MSKPKLTVEMIDFLASETGNVEICEWLREALCQYARIGLAVSQIKPRSLGVATFEADKCWCLRDQDGNIVGNCSQCPIHGEEPTK